jgi:hypothetical protein
MFSRKFPEVQIHQDYLIKIGFVKDSVYVQNKTRA